MEKDLVAKRCCEIKEAEQFVVCPTCLNIISDSTTLRCPRCNSSMIQMGCTGNCSKCGIKK